MNVYAITNAQGENYSTYEVNQKLEELGIPSDVIEQGEDAIEEYAQEKSITLPKSDERTQPQTQTKAQPKEVKGSNDTAKNDYEWQLKAAGIPQSVIVQ